MTIKKHTLALVLAAACATLVSSTASAETTYGLLPGVRWGYGRGTYRANETNNTDPSTRGSGKPSSLSLADVRLTFLADFDDIFAVGAEVGYLWSSISNPANGAGYDDFAYGGWTFGAVGMVAVFDRAFVTGRLGLIRGDVQAAGEGAAGSTGYRAGASLCYAAVHNSIATLTVGLGFDWLRSGTIDVQNADTRYGGWAIVLDLAGSFHLDD